MALTMDAKLYPQQGCRQYKTQKVTDTRNYFSAIHSNLNSQKKWMKETSQS